MAIFYALNAAILASASKSAMEERDASREIRQTSWRHHASDDQAYRSDEFCHLEASTRYNLALSKYPRAVDIAGPARAPNLRTTEARVCTSRESWNQGGSLRFGSFHQDASVLRSGLGNLYQWADIPLRRCFQRHVVVTTFHWSFITNYQVVFDYRLIHFKICFLAFSSAIFMFLWLCCYLRRVETKKWAPEFGFRTPSNGFSSLCVR